MRHLSALVLLIPAAVAATTNCPLQFGPAGGFAIPATAWAIVSADFNSDGRPDVAVITQQSTLTLSVYLQLEDGSFAPGGTYSLPSGLGAMVEADFNGDGFPDLVIASGGLSILLGNGDGTFQPPVSIDAVYENAVLSADVNGDGRVDIVVHGDGGMRTFLGNGDGTFNAVAWTGYGTIPFAVADLDGDGVPDLLIEGGYEHGHGDGVFDYPVSFYPYGYTWATAADVNGDGNMDIVSNGGVFFGQGQGVFTAPGPLPSGGVIAGVGQTALADVDGDGLPDIVSRDSAGIFVMLGHPDGSFSFPLHYIEPAPVLLVVGDLNGDGLADMTFSTSDNHIIALRNRGGGQFSDIPPRTRDGAVGDFNGDGIPDVAMFQPDSSTILQVELGYGDGTFSPAAKTSDLGGAFSFQGAGDVNLDGRDDIVVVLTDTVEVLISGADGTPAATSVLPSAGVTSALLVDLNNDSKLDVVAIGNEIDVFLGNGDGTFQNAIVTPLANPAAGGVAGEFTGDGFADLLVSPNVYSFSGGPALLLPGNGDGTFGPAAQIGTDGSPWQAAALGDLNGDGRLDVVFLHPQHSLVCTSVVHVLLGQPGGSLQEISTPIGFDGGFSCSGAWLAIADFDGDGIPDVVASVVGGGGIGFRSPDYFMAGDGTGALAAPIVIANDGDVLSADFDRDGRPDIAPSLLNRTGVRILNAGALPSGVNGTSYSVSVTAAGAAPPYSFAVTAGALPSGLAFSSSGVLSGTPTTSGPFSFTATATDSGGCSGSKAFTLTILDTAPVPAIAALIPNTLAPGTLGALVEIDGSGFLAVSLVTGNGASLTVEPPIDQAKLFVYVPPAMLASPGSIAIQVTNPSPGGGPSNIVNLPVEKIVLTPQGLPGTVVGAVYSADVMATGGQGPYAYSIASGALPPGLTLDPSTGTISGSPTLGGLFSFKLQAQDSIGAIGVQPLQIFVYVIASTLSFYTIAPCRLVDTRGPAGLYGGPPIPGNGSRRTFSALRQCGLPDDVKALAVNLTVVRPAGFGDFRIFPAGLGGGNASTINFTSRTRANNVILPVNGYPAGSFTVQSDVAFYSTDFLIDVFGYFR